MSSDLEKLDTHTSVYLFAGDDFQLRATDVLLDEMKNRFTEQAFTTIAKAEDVANRWDFGSRGIMEVLAAACVVDEEIAAIYRQIGANSTSIRISVGRSRRKNYRKKLGYTFTPQLYGILKSLIEEKTQKRKMKITLPCLLHAILTEDKEIQSYMIVGQSLDRKNLIQTLGRIFIF